MPKSSLKSARFSVQYHRRQIASRHSMKFHGIGLGTVTLLITWLTSHALMMASVDSMAIRYGVALLAGYFAYLGLLRVWAERLASRSREDYLGDAAELAVDGIDALIRTGGSAGQRASVPPMVSGRGGDFGGGGASGDFGDGAMESSSSGLGEAVGGVFEGAGSVVAESEEGAVVVIPIVAIFLIAVVFFLGLGSIVFLYFGSEALLATAVEIAFSYAASDAAVKIARRGWLGSVFQITWKPLLGALLCAVALGWLFDTFLPNAHSLFDAIRQIQSYFNV